EYAIDRDSLAKHAFVAGVTGGGKTNTIFHLLQQLTGGQVPFPGIEPAKKEDRALPKAGFGSAPRAFTGGDQPVRPLRLNPFEAVAGTPVAVHLDLLRSVFAAGFGMWTPLPQILERCFYKIYADAGWDLASDVNHRLPALCSAEERALAFPTLSDLVG